MAPHRMAKPPHQKFVAGLQIGLSIDVQGHTRVFESSIDRIIDELPDLALGCFGPLSWVRTPATISVQIVRQNMRSIVVAIVVCLNPVTDTARRLNQLPSATCTRFRFYRSSRILYGAN